MTVNLPNSIRIGPVDYTVVLIDDLHDRGEELFGKVTYGDALIRIDTAPSEGRKKNILIHEMVHAMLYEAGYDEQDEDLVRHLSNVMAQVLRDNDFGFMKEVEE